MYNLQIRDIRVSIRASKRGSADLTVVTVVKQTVKRSLINRTPDAVKQVIL
jgi:hypothetical protein